MYTFLPVIIDYELTQKAEEGCNVDPLREHFNTWLKNKGLATKEVFYSVKENPLQLTEEDEQVLESLFKLIISIKNSHYEANHPDSIDGILINVQGTNPFDQSILGDEVQLYDKVYGGWLGRCGGCVLGKPVELWPYERVVSYLKLKGAYPLDNFIPNSSPMPEGYKFKEEYAGATLGDVDGAPRDDDMDYPILNLNVLEKNGALFTSEHIGQSWLKNMTYQMVYTAERVAYMNMINGFKAPDTGTHHNPYREWIGAQIRADLWGWVNPANPKRAVEMAYRDASLSHSKNGIYGELWVAAMLAIAFVESDVEQIIRKSLAYIPSRSKLTEAINNVIQWSHQFDDWNDCFKQIQDHFGKYHTVHTLNNAAVVTMALLYSKGDYHTGITISVMAGWDTDCNGATVGSVLGVVNGAENLPKQWIDPLHDRIESLVFTERKTTLSALAKRTMEQAIMLAGQE